MNHARIELAKQLLKDNTYTVKDIVGMIGYADSSSFARKFKAIVGITPMEYRKMEKE